MDRERFTEHLAAPTGRGVVLSGGFDGHAGGALCGDLVRVSVRVAGDRVVEAGFDAEGCGALTAAASAAVTLVSGEPLLDAARVGTREISEELGGLSPGKLHAADLVADALHRALGRRLRRRRGAARRPPHAGRDERRRGLRGRRAAGLPRRSRGGRGDARAVARRGERRGGVLLLGRRGPARPLGRAPDGHAALHARPARRSSARASWTRSWPATARGRPRTRASAATATCGSTRCSTLAERLGAADLATGHYARVTAGRAAARRRRPGQGPDLHARRARAGLGRPHALPAGRADQARGARAGGRGRAAGRQPRRVPGPLLPGGHGQGALPAAPRGPARTRRGRSCPRPARSSAPTTASTTSPSASARAWACRPPSRSTCCGPRRGRTASSSARATELAVDRVVVRGARLHRPGAEVDAVRLRYHSRAVPCRVAGSPAAGTHRARVGTRRNPSTARLPGSPRAFCAET